MGYHPPGRVVYHCHYHMGGREGDITHDILGVSPCCRKAVEKLSRKLMKHLKMPVAAIKKL